MTGGKVQYFSERVAFAAQELESFKSSCKVFRAEYKRIGCRAPQNNTVFKSSLLKFQTLSVVAVQKFFVTNMETTPTEERKENKTSMKFILQDQCLTRHHLNRHWETIPSALLMPSQSGKHLPEINLETNFSNFQICKPSKIRKAQVSDHQILGRYHISQQVKAFTCIFLGCPSFHVTFFTE